VVVAVEEAEAEVVVVAETEAAAVAEDVAVSDIQVKDLLLHDDALPHERVLVPATNPLADQAHAPAISLQVVQVHALQTNQQDGL
jgi:hypothetical protein